jgi:hypothetical protein
MAFIGIGLPANRVIRQAPNVSVQALSQQFPFWHETPGLGYFHTPEVRDLNWLPGYNAWPGKRGQKPKYVVKL